MRLVESCFLVRDMRQGGRGDCCLMFVIIVYLGFQSFFFWLGLSGLMLLKERGLVFKEQTIETCGWTLQLVIIMRCVGESVVTFAIAKYNTLKQFMSMLMRWKQLVLFTTNNRRS